MAPTPQGGQTVDVGYTNLLATAASRVQDLAGNQAAGFTLSLLDPPIVVDNRTPSVKGLPVFAGAAEGYAIGDVIAVEIEFTEAVSVTTTSSARPEIGIEIGTETRKAVYVSGSGNVQLRFEYEVAEGDADTDGIAIPANALSAPTGSAIRTSAGDRTVQLSHDAIPADAARNVDGVRPTATEASVAGPTVTVTWSEALDESSVPTGRRRIRSADRQHGRPRGERGVGVGLDRHAEPCVRDRRRHGGRDPGVHPARLGREDPRRGG